MKVYILEEKNLILGAFSTFEKAKQYMIDIFEKRIKNIENCKTYTQEKNLIIGDIRSDLELAKNARSRKNFNNSFCDNIWIYEREVDAE